MLFTFYADRFDTDDLLFRLTMLLGMLAVILLAVNVNNAFEGGWVGFALSYVAIRTIILALYVRASRYVPVAGANLKLYLASFIPSTCLWLASVLVSGPERYALWASAVAIELCAPILGSRVLRGTPAHASHLPERFGLFTLIVLGESVVAVATATADVEWQLPSIFAAVGGFAIAACLWWMYFGFLDRLVVFRGVGSVHVNNYGHFFIFAGLTAAAVGIRFAIEGVAAPALDAGPRWALCGGVAL